MRLDGDEARRRVAQAAVGRLASVGPGGAPHLVPVCFAVDGETIYWAVDDKPKRSPALQRLANIERDPRVALLVDHYDDDWTTLWWVRIDGSARAVTDADERHRALAALRGKYPQYAAHTLAGPVVAIDPIRWAGWATAPPG